MPEPHPSLLLSRRELLRAAAVAAGGLALVTLLPGCGALQTELAFDGQRLRASSAGRILISSDNGRTWQQAAAFGDQIEVRGLSKGRGHVLARLDYQGLDLTLKSYDGLTWYTQDYQYPG